MLCVVVVFGAHSLIDWTWYVPGDAVAALICAGWLAGRGPASPHRGPSPPARSGLERLLGARRRGALRLAVAARRDRLSLVIALGSQWQPQRSEEKRANGAGAATGNLVAARATAQDAVSADPLSVEALISLAESQDETGEPASARATLREPCACSRRTRRAGSTLGTYRPQARDQRGPQGAAGRDLPRSWRRSPRNRLPAGATNRSDLQRLHRGLQGRDGGGQALKSATGQPRQEPQAR